MPQNGGGWLNTKCLAVDHEFLLSEGTSRGRGWLRRGESDSWDQKTWRDYSTHKTTLKEIGERC